MIFMDIRVASGRHLAGLGLDRDAPLTEITLHDEAKREFMK